MAAPLLLLWLSAQVAPPTGKPPLPALAVLPLSLEGPAAENAEVAGMLAGALTTRLGAVGTHKVISADEVSALLQHETERQGLGCSDDACLAEVAGALGARFLVKSGVTRQARRWAWHASVIDQQEGTAVRRAEVHAASAQALLAQADELALLLLSKDAEARMQGPAAMERFGLSSEKDLAALRGFKAAHPAMGIREAVTAFVLHANSESRALAATEAALFVTAALLAVPAFPLHLVGFRAEGFALGAGIPFFCCAWCGVGGAALASLAGLVVVVVDALNLGRVPVKRAGCCREDAELSDEEQSRAPLRLAAVAVAASGPLACATTASGCGVLYMLTFPFALLGWLPLLQAGFLTEGSALAALFAVGLLGLCTAPVGLTLLLWPDPKLLEDDATVGGKP